MPLLTQARYAQISQGWLFSSSVSQRQVSRKNAPFRNVGTGKLSTANCSYQLPNPATHKHEQRAPQQTVRAPRLQTGACSAHAAAAHSSLQKRTRPQPPHRRTRSRPSLTPARLVQPRCAHARSSSAAASRFRIPPSSSFATCPARHSSSSTRPPPPECVAAGPAAAPPRPCVPAAPGVAAVQRCHRPGAPRAQARRRAHWQPPARRGTCQGSDPGPAPAAAWPARSRAQRGSHASLASQKAAGWAGIVNNCVEPARPIVNAPPDQQYTPT